MAYNLKITWFDFEMQTSRQNKLTIKNWDELGGEMGKQNINKDSIVKIEHMIGSTKKPADILKV